MKKWLVLIVAVLFILPSAYAGFGVFGSYWDSKDYDSLYGGGIKLGVDLGAGFGLDGRASYLSTDLFEDTDLTMDVIPLEAVLCWTLEASEMFKPYVGAGIGWYFKNVDWEADDIWDDAETKDCLGYFGLAGLNVVFGSVTLFGEAKYNFISEDDDLDWRGSDVDQKYSLDGFAANVGLKIGY